MSQDQSGGLAVTFYVSTGSRDGTDVYHTDRSCERLQDAKRIGEEPLDQLRRRRLRKCKLCSGAADSPDNTDRPCPVCGAEQKGFAAHIRSCGGGSDE